MKKMFLLLGMLAISFLGFAQVSRQQAINSVLNSVVGNNVDNVNVYMEPLPQSDSYYKLSRYDSSLANKCDERMENYDEAIAWYEEVLTNPNTSFNDSIFAAIDLGDLYLRLDEGGEKGICGKMVQYKPKSVYMHNKQTNIALSMIPQKEAGEKDYSDSSPVQNLELSVGSNDTVSISWDLPEGLAKARLSWTDEEIEDVMFSPCGSCEFEGANRFESSDLEGFIGWIIKDISFVPWSSTMEYGIRIWKGTINHLDLLYEQSTNGFVPEVWNTCDVEEVIVIDEDTEYWIGCYAIGSSLSLGVNYGDVVPWKGDLWRINKSDWTSLAEDGLSCSVCISATLVSPDGRVMRMSHHFGNALTGYRIYRDGELIKEIPYSFVTCFTDTQFTKGIDVEYCVTAVYGDEESEPVCATANITGVAEKPENDGITVSPNPTNGMVLIEGVEVAEMQVYNALGQLVKFAQNSNEINLRDLPQGVYSLRITGVKGEITSRKIVVE